MDNLLRLHILQIPEHSVYTYICVWHISCVLVCCCTAACFVGVLTWSHMFLVCICSCFLRVVCTIARASKGSSDAATGVLPWNKLACCCGCVLFRVLLLMLLLMPQALLLPPVVKDGNKDEQIACWWKWTICWNSIVLNRCVGIMWHGLICVVSVCMCFCLLLCLCAIARVSKGFSDHAAGVVLSNK